MYRKLLGMNGRVKRTLTHYINKMAANQASKTLSSKKKVVTHPDTKAKIFILGKYKSASKIFSGNKKPQKLEAKPSVSQFLINDYFNTFTECIK